MVYVSSLICPEPSVRNTHVPQGYGGYITDITRTWPLSGRFAPAQKDLYEAILRVQRSCISLCRGNASVSLDKLHDIAEEGLRDQLKQLGFDISGQVSWRRALANWICQLIWIVIISQALEALFPHHLGHYIGLDVHDTPGHSRKDPLEVGQCVTIEP